MIIYDKLVRDNIPTIIQKSNKDFQTRVINEEEHFDYLNRKFKEEVDEYFEDFSVEELADTVEVIYAILKHHKISIKEFEKIRINKKKIKGGFDKKKCLIFVDE